MKNIANMDLSVDLRVRTAVEQAMEIYLNRLNTGLISLGLEDAFKMHLAGIISDLLNITTYYTDERFIIHFEKNMPINGNNDYVDIVINYNRGEHIEQYLIELKFKKISDCVPDLGNVESYIDIYNLDMHKNNTPNVKGCFFVFLTDLQTYTKASTRGTRKELPMEDGYTICKGKRYVVSGETAKKNTRKFPKGFVFYNNHKIEYRKFNIKEKPYWYYILQI